MIADCGAQWRRYSEKIGYQVRYIERRRLQKCVAQ